MRNLLVPVRRTVARARVATVAAAILAAACDGAAADARPSRASASAAAVPDKQAARDSIARAREDSVNRARPGYVIDSILPVEEEIRRFQATLHDRPDSLSGGATSRTLLVRAFVSAIERRDERALRRLVVNRAEFGYLIYPSSANTRPPYRLSPDIVWLQRSAASEKGAARLLRQFGGHRLAYDGYACGEPAERQGENRVWARCVVRRRVQGKDPSAMRLFGPIIERGGHYKFLSLANDL